jgi:hypothetical protein
MVSMLIMVMIINIFIFFDCWNNHIVKWRCDAKNGQVVTGGNVCGESYVFRRMTLDRQNTLSTKICRPSAFRPTA